MIYIYFLLKEMWLFCFFKQSCNWLTHMPELLITVFQHKWPEVGLLGQITALLGRSCLCSHSRVWVYFSSICHPECHHYCKSVAIWFPSKGILLLLNLHFLDQWSGWASLSCIFSKIHSFCSSAIWPNHT